MIRVGIVGIGKWGKNLLKEFSKISVIPICVTKGNNQNKKWLKTNYPKIKSSKNEKFRNSKSKSSLFNCQDR